MIVKNEEDVLKRCLDSINDIVDEIIIVDTGSKDQTKEIAKMYTDKIYDFEWVEDFAKARNYSFSKATKDYILWLDADDVILETDRTKFKKLKNTLNPNTDIVMMKYHIGLDANDIPSLSYYRERLIKNTRNYHWIGQVHEVIIPTGNIIHSDIAITHKKIKQADPNRNIRIFEKMIKNDIVLDARQTYYYARELFYHQDYRKAITMFEKFLNMKDAWVENILSALLDLSTCYSQIHNEEKELSSLFKSFEFDAPRAETCCYIANYFFKKEKLSQAIFWYHLASTITPNLESGAFYQLDYYGYIPYIQLCVCYYQLGDIKLANEYNEKAGNIKPNDPSYLKNKNFFINSLQD